MEALSILIVDDDKDYVNTLTEILLLHSLVVDTAEDGFKAFEKIKHKYYDIILMDIGMPGINAVETYKKIKDIHIGTMVIMLASPNVETISALIRQGIFSIIQKPYDINKIIDLMDDFERKKNILIVDEDKNDREKMMDYLSEKGYKVLHTNNGKKAIESLDNNVNDAVILDADLEDTDGITVLERVTEFKSSFSIISITGNNLEDIIDIITKKDVYACFLKPFDVDLLLKYLNFFLKKKTQFSINLLRTSTPQKLLVVEDDDSIRETTKEILVEEGYKVDTASSIQQAMKFIENENYSIVLSDLSLGDSSGLSLVDPVRKKDSSTIFLLITGRGTMETALEAIKKNVDEYILKPVEPGELTHKVKSYVEKQKIKKEKETLLKQLQESNNKLLELVKIDELTGTFNRRYLFEQLNNEMQRAKRQRTSLSLMMCDVDGFKQYNDKNGHLEGDKLLKSISSILKSSVRQFVDQVFRYGGDEFAIIVPEITKESSLNLAERVVKKVKAFMKENGKNVGLSIGVTNYGMEDRELSLNELIREADEKLYKAKKSGGNKAVV